MTTPIKNSQVSLNLLLESHFLKLSRSNETSKKITKIIHSYLDETLSFNFQQYYALEIAPLENLSLTLFPSLEKGFIAELFKELQINTHALPFTAKKSSSELTTGEKTSY